MNKRLRIVLAVLSAAFIALNIFLIYKENNTIKRTSYIDSWQKAPKGSLQQTFSSKGVIVPTVQQFVRHDPASGVFQKFLVEEGQEVQAGTPLYTFIPENGGNLQARLEAEKTEVQGAITSTSSHIQRLTTLKSAGSSTNALTDPSEGSSPTDEAAESTEKMKQFEIERELLQLEAEQDRYKARLAGIESQISSLQGGGSEVTVESELDGIVQNLRQDLKNPVITVSGAAVSVEGKLSEAKRKNVKPGMRVSFSDEKGKVRTGGELTKVSPVPDKAPHAKKKSTYTYMASMKNSDPFSLIGSHVNVRIITKEAAGAVIVPKTAVLTEKTKQFIFVLGKDGLVHKTKVKAGLIVGEKRAVTSGLKQGDRIAADYKEILENKGPFFTPLQTDKIKGYKVKQIFSEQKWLIPFLTGIKEG
ncbi:efflux RND transporter periplasmic adaptor subunit [Peribacillus sp. SCS-37]|uniref:efflux RND transporter periplasmic adaptor subunit n=1 Tax=Paraperibacillus esterisolvens TaxID=3115296 RepID=UPI003905C09A